MQQASLNFAHCGESNHCKSITVNLNEKKHTQTPRYREKKMQMQSEESEPKKSKFGVFREIPKDRAVGRLDRASGKKHREKNTSKTSRGVGELLFWVGGWVCVFFFGGVVGLFWGDLFLKSSFCFLSC